MSLNNQNETSKSMKKTWTKPELKYVGHVGDVLQGGGGKLTPSPADPGESRKPSGVGGEGK
ncbi:MAG: hypothetical protein LBQ09_12870 [Acidobacteriaceae bacterium]|jgi:hypothetical protein|nr:hypothetical protein [Acidobacteriaceae bacterium]